MTAAEDQALTVGDLTLCTGSASLTGPNGTVRLAAQIFRLAERLFRRPGMLASEGDLISAMYPDPDREADTASTVLRIRIQALRGAMMVLSPAGVHIRTERGIGWAVEGKR